jgi:hypothetical protein
MKYIKLFEQYKTKEEEFFEYLSMKFGQPIGSYLGSGMLGMIYCFGKDCKRAIKLTSHYDKNYASIKDKNIKGVVKVFSNGKIKVPNILTEDGKYIDLGNGLLRVDKTGHIYYTIMEYIEKDESLTHSIEDLNYAIEEFISQNYDYEFEVYNGDEIPMLRMFFLECENMDFLQDLYDFTYKYYDTKVANSTVEIMAELAVLFKNIKTHFDWHDIHADQFGYNSKGEIVAYDIDNPVYLAPEDVNTYIKESYDFEYETMVAYHGSPHNFDYFSNSMIGQGEGASGFGYGIYFSEDFDDAMDYARKLEREEGEGMVYTCEIPDKEYLLNINNDLEDQSDYVKHMLMSIPNDDKIKIMSSESDFLEFKEKVDEEIDEYDFEIGDDEYKEFLQDILDTDFMDLGNHFFDLLKQNLPPYSYMDGEAYASDYLKEIGIKGIVHNDFHYDNYVIFNDDEISILESVQLRDL